MSKEIQFYNTKSKKVEEFKAINSTSVGIYSCGPTVYHDAHIGNLRAYVFADILRRSLTRLGFDVKHVINITDVGHMVGDGDNGQDKLEKGAEREGKNVWEIAKMYTDTFLSDLVLLNIPLDKYVFPRATDHIQEQIALVSALEIQGHTYRTSDGIYFDTATFPAYADFAHLDVEGLKNGARIEENKEKKNSTDFALWKFSPKGQKRQMEWESPWGTGFPGWHIECSAMSMKFLGTHFDIHTGGIDHIPVHHTNEIAQSESVTGEPYANYWMHVNFLNEKEGKMSKSNEDFLTLKALTEKGFTPLAYRYYLLTANYRSEMEFSFDTLKAQQVAYEKLCTWCSVHKTELTDVSESYMSQFDEAIHDDLSTPQGIAIIWKMLKDESLRKDFMYSTLIKMDEVLGLNLIAIQKVQDFSHADDISDIIKLRDKARSEKNFEESDRLRKIIEDRGYVVKDTPEGTKVYAEMSATLRG
jgi:cysteinyl-tRNA synthetase